MEILVNATTLVVGGGIQVAASFISEAEAVVDCSKITSWHYAVSPQIAAEINIPSERLHVFLESPAKCMEARRQLVSLADRLDVDAVFTIFGPAYVRFRQPHLSGIADGWLTHSTWQAFQTIKNPVKMLRTLGLLMYKAWWLRYADAWVVEAENAKVGLQRRFHLSPDRVFVVPNTCARNFRNLPRSRAGLPESGKTIRMLYLSAYYRHKNIEIIPSVAAALHELKPDLKFTFVLTLKSDLPEWKALLSTAVELGVGDFITTLGPVAINDAPALYLNSHIAFMPSLLETFSANYPEAMASGCPLVVSDLEFSHAICKNAATYFDPTDPKAAAQAIVELINDSDRWSAQIDTGFKVLDELPTSTQRYERYTQLLLGLLE